MRRKVVRPGLSRQTRRGLTSDHVTWRDVTMTSRRLPAAAAAAAAAELQVRARPDLRRDAADCCCSCGGFVYRTKRRAEATKKKPKSTAMRKNKPPCSRSHSLPLSASSQQQQQQQLRPTRGGRPARLMMKTDCCAPRTRSDGRTGDRPNVRRIRKTGPSSGCCPGE